MELRKDTVYNLPVQRVEFFNGRRTYIVLFEDKEYRVRFYPHQNTQRKELPCVYVGDTRFGTPQFEQSFYDVLSELYQVGSTYPFKISQECIDQNTGSFYYKLADEYGFYHRVYMTKNPMYKQGDKVEAVVKEITDSYMALDMLPPASAKASFSLGDLVDLKSVIEPNELDFSRIDPGRDTTLRDYQIENKRKIYEAWQHCRSVMLQMPTGTGKTRLFVSIARDIFDYSSTIKRTLRVLILAHRKELIEQISEHLGQKYRLAHGLIMSQNIEQRKYTMQVGSVPTLNRRLERWEDKKFDVIIIDEAHHVKAKSYKKIIDLFPNAKILGVTATPYRLNHAGFRPEFDELIVSPSVNEFIKRGYLCEFDYFSIRPNSDLQKEIDRMKLDFEGDYKESEMMNVMDRDFIRADILDAYLKYAKDKKGIVYTISREHNVHLAEKFKEAGIESAAIDSETPKEKRDELVNKFRRGDIQVLFNVNIFSEGFDCPDVEVIQLARPTKSLSMYLQQVGRGLRPAEGKDKLIILDNVGLYNKFGFPSARRKWNYHFEGQDVDESPAAHSMEREEEREVQYIVEGSEDVALVHSSTTEEMLPSELDSIVRDYKGNFVKYALQELDIHTVHGYVRAIESYLDGYIREHFDRSFRSMFNTVNSEQLQAIRDYLVKDSEYVAFNNKKHHTYSAAFRKYRAFALWYNKHQNDMPALPEIEAPEESPKTADDYLDAFKDYLKRDKYSPSGVSKTIDMLSSVIDPNIKTYVDNSHVSVFHTVNVEDLTRFYVKLMSNLSFISLNKMKSSQPSSALKKYLDFAKSYSQGTGSFIEGPAIKEDSSFGALKVYDPEFYKYQEEFEKYLEARFIKAPAIRKYSSIVKDDIDPLVRKLIDSSFKSAYYSNDLNTVNNLYNLLSEEDEFKSMNQLRANAADVVLRKYIKFIQETYPGSDSTLQKEHQKPAANSAKSVSDDLPSSVSEINKTLKELDDLIALLKKNHLPVNPEVEDKKQRLLTKKASILQADSIINPITDYLGRNGLTKVVTFKYVADKREVDILDPVFEPSLKQSMDDIAQIESLMSKNNLPISDDVSKRKAALIKQWDLKEKIRYFDNWLVGHMTYLKLDSPALDSVYYSPRTGFKISYKGLNSIETTVKTEEPETQFVVDKIPAPKVKGKSVLQVRVGKNRIICRDTATDTFVDAIEEMGVNRVKGIDYQMYGRPIIAPKPHPNYKTQCKRLSNGEYLMTLTTTEKKMQLINSFAKYLKLPIVAEIVGSKK